VIERSSAELPLYMPDLHATLPNAQMHFCSSMHTVWPCNCADRLVGALGAARRCSALNLLSNLGSRSALVSHTILVTVTTALKPDLDYASSRMDVPCPSPFLNPLFVQLSGFAGPSPRPANLFCPRPQRIRLSRFRAPGDDPGERGRWN
jgi:hypothetical protein